jgi:NAD(P)-dependent dehydrogenase (short-subunit alcohol dehydrogenase family)
VDRDAGRAGRVASETGGIAISADVTSREGVEAVITDAVEGLGGIDGYVDIVGMGLPSTLLDVTDDFWDAQFAVNFRHALLLAQLVGRHLVAHEQGGSIVHIVSDCGRGSSPAQVAYGAAKAALISLTRTAAVELSPTVRVNAVSPGFIVTPRTGSTMHPDTLAAMAANAPLQRNGTPSDIASAVLFLLSGLAAYVTGQVLVVDGGVDVNFAYPIGGPKPATSRPA